VSVIDKIMEGAAFSDWHTITDGRPLLVSLSGGKDSTAVLLWLRGMGRLLIPALLLGLVGYGVYRFVQLVRAPLDPE